jgi:hypothetical protein
MLGQKYHSLKARGENVEELLKAAENHHNGMSVLESKSTDTMLTLFKRPSNQSGRRRSRLRQASK